MKTKTLGEANKTEIILEKRKQKRKPIIKNINTLLYWTLLIISIIGNFIISVVLVPFLLILKGPALYFSLFFLSLSFGYLFSFVLHSIEELQPKQYIIAHIFIPSIALINIAIITVLSNKLILLLKLTTPFHNPLLVGMAYFVGYLTPEALKYRKR
ncbi:hypothetical protein B6U93_01325 [Candidatus Woesearchaeota archaeon ex4484_78]|nr:MAG: hypothetical protein B6U93_01325 [Candidatus Woesearchaeota archaeon ex4484_78]